MNALSFKSSKMCDLPKHRDNMVKPYNHTRVDFTSNLWVKGADGNSYKMYMFIFICLNICSLYVELVPDMTTGNFMLAFQRFINLYGIPSII